MKKDKKGILGMNTAQQFIVGILSLVILAVVTLVILAAVKTTIPDETDTITLTNESSVITVNETGVQWPGTSLLDECTLSVTYANILANNSLPPMTTGNYSVSDCVLTGSADGKYNNSVWNITGSYYYTVGSRRKAIRIIDNTSSGLSGLFGNAVTWFTLLGLVIIILIIGVVIGVIRGFGSQQPGSGAPRVAQL